jgi:GMP synthase (glutamine-hydrolysing)
MTTPTPPGPPRAAHERVLILDFGSQVTQLIARRVREAHVYCEIHPNDVSDAFIRDFAPKAIILSGSHASTYEDRDLRAPAAVWELGVPVLGICYGMFAMAVQLGGDVEPSAKREFGYAEVRGEAASDLLAGIADHGAADGAPVLKVWMSHGDKVTSLPPGFATIASSANCPVAAMADARRRFYGVQFHPEVTHTLQGRAILERFVLGIAGVRPDWIMRDHIAEAVEAIRAQVGTERVVLGLSRDRGPADLRLRRPRAASSRRRPHGHGHVRRPPAGPGRPCRCRGAVHVGPRRDGRSRGQAQDHRP